MNKFVIFIITVLVAVFGVIYLSTNFLMQSDELQKADAIVALSGGDTGGRAARAIAIYQQGYAPLIVFSGAAKDPSSPSNARVMERLATESGVPSSAVRIDELSRDTKENAQGVKNILIDSKKIILVTSEYHQKRAHAELQAQLPDVEIIDAPAKDKNWNKYTWWLNPYGWWITVSEVVKNVI
jgi:uncharacterized SAM-binding protein YcdF (DUF218 family)